MMMYFITARDEEEIEEKAPCDEMNKEEKNVVADEASGVDANEE